MTSNEDMERAMGRHPGNGPAVDQPDKVVELLERRPEAEVRIAYDYGLLEIETRDARNEFIAQGLVLLACVREEQLPRHGYARHAYQRMVHLREHMKRVLAEKNQWLADRAKLNGGKP